ncbi:MAG: hypothetical protein KDA41_21160, partial [Planctomycetales bacterium]|nr:hypothetical protein [Planctomycetales bacterium]
PTFAHVPLVVGEDGRRLAKRHGDTRLAELRRQGIDARKLVGMLAASCGLRPTAEPCAAADLLGEFDPARLSRSPSVYSTATLARLL